MPPFRQARRAQPGPKAGTMSTFALGQMQVRRSGYGAMQLAGPYAFGPPPDRATAIGVLRATVAAGVDHIDTAQYYGSGVVNGLIRDEGLIAGIGLSNVSLDQLQHAAAGTGIVCVQNLFHLAFRYGTPVLEECLRRGIAFVPFCPLGWPRGADNPVLTSPVVIQTAARLGIMPAQVALRWLLQLAPNVLLIPGTGSVAHLRENLAAERVVLDDEALRDLDSVGA
jgi:aryl-alcohol dehydrogenase-like predicted oxidoreductase